MRTIATLLVLVLSGCGSHALFPVEGTILLDGKPLDKVNVTFTPESGGTSGAGTTDANGKFIIGCPLGLGLPEGRYKVYVTEPTVAEDSNSQKFEAGSDSADYEKMAIGNVGDHKQAKKKNRVPEKYDSNSDLVATVGTSQSNFDFDLQSK